ncbi:Lrp/AsnC family transcriptional regulator [Streptosporangium saharense]|uniref:Lrp/AsnC family transcriptional regulator n=1 Tax=Streptosporangium saharense TaxID=1706840 RepID=UPI00343B467F
MDEIDALLLDLLQHDAGRTLHDLGEQVGLSASAVQRRIARYRKEGLIARQVAVLAPHRLGPTVLATVLVTLDQESFEHHRVFSERMCSDPQIQQCYRVAGPWDYVVILAARSMHDCGRLGDRLFKADDNVRRYETLVTFEAVKTGLALPVPTLHPSRP